MPTQSQIETTLLNGAYKLATLANTNLIYVNNGMLAVKETFINWFSLNLNGLSYQYDNGIYNTATTLTLYNRINYFVGIPAGATIDPNFQGGNTIIIIENTTGAEPITYNYNETYLLNAGTMDDPIWYLPYLTPEGGGLQSKTPIYMAIDNSEIPTQLNTATSPARLYGFANNDTQTITLTVI